MIGSRRNQTMSSSNYRNPCLTMHQPWASLLVYGIKRVEGRTWPSPVTGRVWIHAAAKVPEQETIKAMEDFYREIYAMDGITDIKFPEHYPVSRLLGCVEVVGCVTCDELVSWEAVRASVRLEGQTPFCWLCEQPQKLIVPFEMRGYQGVYNLEKKVYEGATRGLSTVKAPSPVKFPLPNPQDRLSLTPGSLTTQLTHSSSSKEEKSPSLVTAIAGAKKAATRFSKNNSSQRSTEDNSSNQVPLSTPSIYDDFDREDFGDSYYDIHKKSESKLEDHEIISTTENGIPTITTTPSGMEKLYASMAHTIAVVFSEESRPSIKAFRAFVNEHWGLKSPPLVRADIVERHLIVQVATDEEFEKILSCKRQMINGVCFDLVKYRDYTSQRPSGIKKEKTDA